MLLLAVRLQSDYLSAVCQRKSDGGGGGVGGSIVPGRIIIRHEIQNGNGEIAFHFYCLLTLFLRISTAAATHVAAR